MKIAVRLWLIAIALLFIRTVWVITLEPVTDHVRSFGIFFALVGVPALAAGGTGLIVGAWRVGRWVRHQAI